MHLHLESSGETLWAVIVGAALATAGGFIASQLEAHMRRRERERAAALMFGEMLSALETIAEIAAESRGRGEPYGSFTLRLIRAAQREIETYERNRTSLYDLRSAEIRIRIHVLMVQISLSLGGVSDTTSTIAVLQNLMDDADLPQAKLDQIKSRIEQAQSERDGAFQYIQTVTGEIKSIVLELQPLAKLNFADLKKFSGNPFTASEAAGA